MKNGNYAEYAVCLWASKVVERPVKWVAARIEDSRSAYRYGRVGYLVTAQLLACIDERNRAVPKQFMVQSKEA
jgi:CO/xanthine dehydrogenase Mo-binding subunit